MVFHWSLSDSKFPQVSETLLFILADLNSAVLWMVSSFLLTFKSFITFTNPVGIVPSTPKTIGITITFTFHIFFFVHYQGLGTYLCFCSLLTLLYRMS